jgi:fatty-acid peroxygenase
VELLDVLRPLVAVARLWPEPERFDPAHFDGWSWDEDPYSLIAQGGGRHLLSHRCPGEWATITVVRGTARALARSNAVAPPQDLVIPLDRMPTLPGSGLVLRRMS